MFQPMSSANLPGFRVRAGLNAQPFHVLHKAHGQPMFQKHLVHSLMSQHHKLKAHRKMSLAARDDMYTSLLQTEIKQKLQWFGKHVTDNHIKNLNLLAHRKMTPVVPIGSLNSGKKIVAAIHVNTGVLGERTNGVETIAAVIANVGDVIRTHVKNTLWTRIQEDSTIQIVAVPHENDAKTNAMSRSDAVQLSAHHVIAGKRSVILVLGIVQQIRVILVIDATDVRFTSLTMHLARGCPLHFETNVYGSFRARPV